MSEHTQQGQSRPGRTPRVGGQAMRQPAGEDLSGTRDELARLAEALLTEGQKGRLLTEAIIASGYARDPQALRAAYQRNQRAIDDYLAQIDTAALASGADTERSGAQGAALGFAGGAVLSYFFSQMSS